MAIFKIAKMGHPVLSKSADIVDAVVDTGIRDLVSDMIETLADANGAGLAAPQVHVSKRIVIFQAPAERKEAADTTEERYEDTAPLTVLINPEIEFLTEETEYGWEGCLSVPGLRGLVPRCTHIRYKGLDTEGEKIDREATGFHARVVQHECDHLDGILYPQRMTDLSDLIFESEFRHRLRISAEMDGE